MSASPISTLTLALPFSSPCLNWSAWALKGNVPPSFLTAKRDIILIVPPGLFFIMQLVDGTLCRGGPKSWAAPADMTREKLRTVQWAGRKQRLSSTACWFCLVALVVQHHGQRLKEALPGKPFALKCDYLLHSILLKRLESDWDKVNNISANTLMQSSKYSAQQCNLLTMVRWKINQQWLIQSNNLSLILFRSPSSFLCSHSVTTFWPPRLGILSNDFCFFQLCVL